MINLAVQTPVASMPTMSVIPISGNLQPLNGDKDDENPRQFITSFLRTFSLLPDDRLVTIFPRWIEEGEAADEWYHGLQESVRENWTELMKGFDEKYPKVTVVRKTQEEYEEEIQRLKLDEEMSETKETLAGREMWSHVAWAEKMAKLASGANVAGGSLYMGTARKNLPKPIRDRIGTRYPNWSEFLKAIREIDVLVLKEAMEDVTLERARIRRELAAE